MTLSQKPGYDQSSKDTMFPYIQSVPETLYFQSKIACHILNCCYDRTFGGCTDNSITLAAIFNLCINKFTTVWL